MINTRAKLTGWAMVMTLAAGHWCPAQVRADEGEPQQITLFAAVGMALDQYPALRLAEAEYGAARAALRATRAAYFPTLQLSGTLTRYEKPMVVAPLHGFSAGQFPEFDRTLLQGGLRLGYLVFDGFQRSAHVRQSNAEARAAEAAKGGMEQTVIAQTVTAYLGVQTKREILDAHRRRVAAFEAELARVNQRQRVGKAADVEVLRIEAVLAAARADLVNLEETSDLALRDLARITGLAPEALEAGRLLPLRITDSTMRTRAEWLEQAARSNLELQRARWRTAAAAAGQRAARSARWPRLHAAASYLGFDSPDVDGAYEWNAGLELTFPVFSGGAISAAIARATAREEAAAEDERRSELEVQEAVDRALSAIRQARARAASLARAVDRYAEVVRIEKLLLESGAGTQSDYLDSEANLLAARAGFVEARHRIIAAEVELAKVTGILTRAWLEDKLEHTQ